MGRVFFTDQTNLPRRPLVRRSMFLDCVDILGRAFLSEVESPPEFPVRGMRSHGKRCGLHSPAGMHGRLSGLDRRFHFPLPTDAPTAALRPSKLRTSCSLSPAVHKAASSTLNIVSDSLQIPARL